MEKLSREELEEIRKARREYMKEYRKRPEAKKKAKEYRARYWLKKAQEMKEAE